MSRAAGSGGGQLHEHGVGRPWPADPDPEAGPDLAGADLLDREVRDVATEDAGEPGRGQTLDVHRVGHPAAVRKIGLVRATTEPTGKPPRRTSARTNDVPPGTVLRSVIFPSTADALP